MMHFFSPIGEHEEREEHAEEEEEEEEEEERDYDADDDLRYLRTHYFILTSLKNVLIHVS